LLHLIRATKINANGSHARHFLVTAISRLCIMWRRKERCDFVSDVLTNQNRAKKNYAKNRHVHFKSRSRNASGNSRKAWTKSLFSATGNPFPYPNSHVFNANQTTRRACICVTVSQSEPFFSPNANRFSS
jgi:hypothetical protein